MVIFATRNHKRGNRIKSYLGIELKFVRKPFWILLREQGPCDRSPRHRYGSSRGDSTLMVHQRGPTYETSSRIFFLECDPQISAWQHTSKCLRVSGKTNAPGGGGAVHLPTTYDVRDAWAIIGIIGDYFQERGDSIGRGELSSFHGSRTNFPPTACTPRFRRLEETACPSDRRPTILEARLCPKSIHPRLLSTTILERWARPGPCGPLLGDPFRPADRGGDRLQTGRGMVQCGHPQVIGDLEYLVFMQFNR